MTIEDNRHFSRFSPVACWLKSTLKWLIRIQKIWTNEHFFNSTLEFKCVQILKRCCWKGVIHLSPVFIMQCVVPLFDTEGLWYQSRVPFQYRDCLSICRIPISKIIRSWDRIIFIFGIPISVRRNDYIETTPRFSLICIPLWLGVFVDL